MAAGWRIVYGDTYEGNESEIENGAAMRAYAKPLLTALVLHGLCAMESLSGL